MITTFYPPYNFGGDGIFVHRLSNELAQSGHHVDVIHCVDSYRLLARSDPLKTHQDYPNVVVHSLRSPFGFLSPLATYQTGFPLLKSRRIRQVLDKGFDVIHYHNISLVGGPKILEYGEGIKLYTMHEYWLICPTHVLFRFNRAACTQRHCLLCSLACKRLPQWWRYSRLLQSTVKHVDAFIAQSLFARDKHLEMGLNLPIVHIPSFIPAADNTIPSSEEVQAVRVQQPYFLFVGRLEKLKGLQTLIPVFQNDRRAHLLIAGRGSYEPQLRQLARGSENILFLGHLRPGQLDPLYRGAVALIVPSVCYEIMPLVIIEAFKQATPVLARNIGGTPELVAESGGGFLYDTTEQLMAAMDQLLTNDSLRRELGTSGYRAYQDNWTAEAHLNRYFTLIQEVAAARGRPL